MSDETRVTRRALLAGAALTAGGVLLERLPLGASQPQAPPVDPSLIPGGATTAALNFYIWQWTTETPLVPLPQVAAPALASPPLCQYGLPTT